MQAQIPALILKPGRTNPSMAAEAFWRAGRSMGGPWTFAIGPNAVHQNSDDRKKANALVVPWIAAVLRLRLSPEGSTFRPIDDSSAWLGDNNSQEVAPHATFVGTKTEASWLPDGPSVRGWLAVLNDTRD